MMKIILYLLIVSIVFACKSNQTKTETAPIDTVIYYKLTELSEAGKAAAARGEFEVRVMSKLDSIYVMLLKKELEKTILGKGLKSVPVFTNINPYTGEPIYQDSIFLDTIFNVAPESYYADSVRAITGNSRVTYYVVDSVEKK